MQLQKCCLPSVWLATAATCFYCLQTSAQLSITMANTPVIQNFDALPSTGIGHLPAGTIFDQGWSFLESGTSGNTTYQAGTGSNDNRDTYSFGAAGTGLVTDRAFGMLQSGGLNSIIGLKITNNTGQLVSSLTIGYTGELWRLNGAGDELLFSFQAGNVALNAATGWQAVSALKFATPATGSGAVDGNIAVNRTVITSVTLTGLYIPDGTTITLRWIDPTGTISAGMAIDDFSVSLIPASTAFFRSRSSGNWNDVNVWETSNDQVSWTPATNTVPTAMAAGIVIMSGNEITVSADVVAGKIVVQPGAKLRWTGGNFTLADAAGDDLILQGTNSSWEIAGAGTPVLNSGASVRIGAGAMLQLSGNNSVLTYHGSAYTYSHGAVFEYRHNGPPPVTGTFFTSLEAGAIPVFRYNSADISALGTAGPTTIQGRIEVTTGRTMNLNNVTGTLTIRNGVQAEGNFLATTAVFSGPSATLGGAGNINAHVSIEPGCTTTLQSDIVFTNNKLLTVNGTLEMGNWQFRTASGSATVSNGATGVLRTTNAAGLLATAGSFKTGMFSLAFQPGSTVDYYADGDQVISIVDGVPYQHLKVSGLGRKTVQGGANLNVQGSCSIHSGATLALTGGAAENLYLNNNASLQVLAGGTFDNGGESQITSSGGMPAIAISGTFVTQDQHGFIGTSSAIPSITPTLLTGCTIQYGRIGDQAVQATVAYEHLAFSGSGIKTPANALSLNGTVFISGSAVVNGSSRNIGGTENHLVMTGSSRLIVGGTGTQPTIGGTYTLAPGTSIEFSNSDLTTSTIRQGGASLKYATVDITGSNVSVPLSGITLQSGATLTVKTGGTLKLTSPNGLYGPVNAAILSTNNPSLVLQSGSIIEYNGNDQVLSSGFTYSQITISGTGVKTAPAPFIVEKRFTRSGSASLSGESPVYGAGAMLAYVDPAPGRTYHQGPEWPALNAPADILVNLNGNLAAVILNANQTISQKLTLTAGSLSLNDKQLTVGGDISGGGTITGSIASGLTLNGGTSLLSFSQTTDGVSNALRSLTINGGTATLAGRLNVFQVLDVAGGTLNLDNRSLVLKSGATGTARVAERKGQLVGETNVTAERFINAAHQRRWRLLTGPVRGTSINAAWQEGRTWNGVTQDNNSTGFGTLITGQAQGNAGVANGNGFDFWAAIAQASASIRRYQGAANSSDALWQVLPSTLNVSFDNDEAYLLFLRGDRTVTSGGGGTVLRATGTLKDASVTTLPLQHLQSHTLIGNPYASPVNFKKIFDDNSGIIQPYYWIWQASLGSTGGYALVKPVFGNSADYELIPDGGGNSSPVVPVISSGEGFFVVPQSGTPATLLIRQAHKEAVNTGINVFRQQGAAPSKLYFNIYSVRDGDSTLLDGALAQYEEGAVKSQSIGKAVNHTVNLAIRKNKKELMVAVDRLSENPDTLQLKIWNSGSASYTLRIRSRDFHQQGLRAWLLDKYRQKEVPLPLTNAVTTYDFNTTDTGSRDPLRFAVIFRSAVAATLPLHTVDLKLYKRPGGVQVEWQVPGTKEIKLYEVERSVNGAAWKVLTSVPAGVGSGPNVYSFFDISPVPVSSYRIRVLGVSGDISYSRIVTLRMLTTGEAFELGPNPLSSGTLTLRFNLRPAGRYRLTIYNSAGQQVWQQYRQHEGGNGFYPLALNQDFSTGTYILEVGREGETPIRIVFQAL